MVPVGASRASGARWGLRGARGASNASGASGTTDFARIVLGKLSHSY